MCFGTGPSAQTAFKDLSVFRGDFREIWQRAPNGTQKGRELRIRGESNSRLSCVKASRVAELIVFQIVPFGFLDRIADLVSGNLVRHHLTQIHAKGVRHFK